MKNIFFNALLFFLLLLGCNQKASDELMPLPKEIGKVEDRLKDINLTFKPQVDVLFVVDNSGSMGEHQIRLSQNIDLFVNRIFQNQIIDYHIGVLTSDMRAWNRDSGVLYGSPRYIKRTTPDGPLLLSMNLRTGTGGSANEQFFEPVKAALTEPLLSGKNSGFYRDNAFLAIMFITDGRSNGMLDSSAFFQFLLKLKNFDADKIIAYGGIIPPGVEGCIRDLDGQPYEIFDFIVKKAKGQCFNLCDLDFGEKMAKIGEDLKNRIEMFIPLKILPVVDTIVVKWGTEIIPRDVNKGWSYDPKRVGIYLGSELDLAAQPNGAELTINFTPAKIE